MTVGNILMLNYVTLCLAVGMGLLALSNRTFDQRSTNYFLAFILIVLVLDVADMADGYLAGLEAPTTLRYITSAVGYTLRPASIAIIINILNRRKKFQLMLWLPVLAVAAVAFTSRSTHLMFSFGENNYFSRGPLGFLPYVASGFYMLLLIVFTLRVHRYLDIGETITVFYICATCVGATALESISSTKYLLAGTLISGCALYYIVLYTQSHKRDILTGALNRRCLFSDAEQWRNTHYAAVSVDLNKLKAINDTGGHQAGDEALRTLVNTMQPVAGNRFRVYRVGGDEFVAIGREQSEQAALKFIEDCRAALKKTPYSASFGCAMHAPHDNADSIFNKADDDMYADKRRFHNRTEPRE